MLKFPLGRTVLPLVALAAVVMPMRLFAQSVYYVSETGDDAKSGLTPDEPFATLAKAIATANGDATTKAVVVLSSLSVPAPVEIKGPYTLKGHSDDPAETVLTAQGSVAPIVKAAAAGATVAGLTLSGGTSAGLTPANLWLTAGTVATNCTIRDAQGDWVRMAAVKNENGLVTHCLIERNAIRSEQGAGLFQTGSEAVLAHSVIRDNTSQHWNGKGVGVFLAGGTVRFCEITGNSSATAPMTAAAGAGIYVSGPSVVHHCLVARNKGGCTGQQMSATSGAAIHVVANGVVVSNCTVVANEALSGFAAGLSNGGSNNRFSDLILWGNEGVAPVPAGGSPDAYPGRGTWTKILSPLPIGADPVEGEPGFVDFEAGDFTLTAGSPAIGAGTDGGDLGYRPFEPSSFVVGLEPFGAPPVAAGRRTFKAVARVADGAVTYRWRLDDLALAREGTWSDYADTAIYEADLVPGHFNLHVEAKDAAGSVASAAADIRVATPKAYLVPAGNVPVAPYATPETAANDVREALRYCGAGSELVVADGEYGVDGELVVGEGVVVKSVNGPEKTTFRRNGAPGQGGGFRIVKLAGAGSVLSGVTLSNAFLNDKAHVGAAAFVAAGALLEDCIVEKFGRGADNAVYCVDGTVRGCLFRDADGYGSSDSIGGALFLTGAKALVCDTVFSNLYPSVSWKGAGSVIHAEGDSRIIRCTIRDCKNQRKGINNCGLGAVFLNKASICDSVVDNCQFRLGAGIYVKGGPAEVVNCTIVGNRAQASGGGLYVEGNPELTVKNTVFFGNTADSPAGPGDPSWFGLGGSKAKVSFLAAPTAAEAIGEGSLPLPAGPGFTDLEKGDYTLSQSSPCRDKGDNGTRLETETDVAGNSRIVKGTIDIGAFEYQVSETLTCGLTVSGHDVAGEPVVLTASVDGANLEGLHVRWRYTNLDRGETIWTSESTSLEEHLPLPAGRYAFALEAWTTAQPQRTLFEDPVVYDVVAKDIFLVMPANATGDPLYPYGSWETAATNLAMAMTAAGHGSTVTVAKGDYAVESTVVLDKSIRLVSVDGPKETSIYRGYPFRDKDHVFPSLFLNDAGAFVSGFTVSNHIAAVGEDGSAIQNHYGTIDDCVITGNDNTDNSLSGLGRGGALQNFNGLVRDCLFEGNTGGAGGGVAFRQSGAQARTERCVIRNNRYGSYHGLGIIVVEGGVVSGCVITNNSVADTARNGQFSGGACIAGGTLYNCLIARNQGAGGAGGVLVKSGSIVNCTIVSNVVSGVIDNNSSQAGGIAAWKDCPGVYVTNSIIADNWNTAADGTLLRADNAARFEKSKLVLSHTLLDTWARIDPDAEKCLAVDPAFKGAARSNWRLASRSPCRDAGVTLDFQRTGLDLDGRPRVVHDDLVDLGCYEADYVSPGLILMMR